MAQVSSTNTAQSIAENRATSCQSPAISLPCLIRATMRPMRRQPDRYVPHSIIELDVLDGLEALASDEVEQLRPAGRVERPRPGALRFDWQGDLRPLLGLRCVIAASLSLTFPIPRPKALLEHQHLTLLFSSIESILQLHPPG